MVSHHAWNCQRPLLTGELTHRIIIIIIIIINENRTQGTLGLFGVGPRCRPLATKTRFRWTPLSTEWFTHLPTKPGLPSVRWSLYEKTGGCIDRRKTESVYIHSSTQYTTLGIQCESSCTGGRHDMPHPPFKWLDEFDHPRRETLYKYKKYKKRRHDSEQINEWMNEWMNDIIAVSKCTHY